MVRNAMFSMVLGALALGAAPLVAQEEAPAPKPLRFDPMVKVMELDKGERLLVTLPGAQEPVEAIAYKAYPYGSRFEAAKGTTFRVLFSNLTYAIVRGPAVFVPRANDQWRKVILDAQKGDFNMRVDERTLPGQFEVVTPLGTFTSMHGMSKLHIGDIAKDKAIDKDDFSFRTLAGDAVFKGLHYNMNGLTQANAFSSADTKGLQTSTLTGRLGEVKMDIPAGNGASTPFSLTPGSSVQITRAKARGSDNWVVSVLTLYANGQAKNDFCYVENRGEGYSTGELIAEVLPEDSLLDENGDPIENAAGGEGESAADVNVSAGEAIPDELSDFDDGMLL